MMTKQTDKSYPQNSTALDVMRLYASQLARYKGLVSFMMVAIVVGNVIQIIVPLYYKQFFDILATTTDVTMRTGAVSQLEHIIVLILVLHLFKWVAYRFMSFCNTY